MNSDLKQRGKYHNRKCKIMNLGAKKQNFSYQLEAQQLQISLKHKPAWVSLFTKGKNNVTSDNKLLPSEREKY